MRLRLGDRRGQHRVVLRWLIIPLILPRQKATHQTSLGLLLLNLGYFLLIESGRHSLKRKERDNEPQ